LTVRTDFADKDVHGLKVKEWKMIFLSNGTQKKTGVTILYPQNIPQAKIQFNSIQTQVRRDKETYYILVKRTIQRVCNDYKYICTHVDTPHFIKQYLLDIKVKITVN
jgi:hypothetical protein